MQFVLCEFRTEKQAKNCTNEINRPKMALAKYRNPSNEINSPKNE